MPGKRPVSPEDVARGERFAALRASRWPSQAAMAKATRIDRLRVMRLETGEERFTSQAFQEELATTYGVPASALLDYVRGRIELGALLGGDFQPGTSQPAPPRDDDVDPYPNRALALKLYDDILTPQTKDFLRSMARSGGDAPIDEWRRIALEAERDRSAFRAELSAPMGIGDPGGFGDPDEPLKRKRR